MNEKDYCSPEMAKRLQEAGIEIETEKHWIVCKDGVSFLAQLGDIGSHAKGEIATWYSAPSLSEAWREIQRLGITSLQMKPDNDNPLITVITYYEYPIVDGVRTMKPTRFINENPVDACCELLIWLSQQEKGERHVKQ